MRNKIRHISYNGELIPESQFKLQADNRGFLYGDGLFETMRSNGVTIPLFNHHMDRLFRGMEVLKISAGISRTQLQKWIESLIQRDLLFTALRIRITVTRQSGGLYSPENNGADILIQIKPIDGPGYAFNRKGLLVDVFTEHRMPVSSIWNFKVGSALPYVLAGIFKTEQKLDDCLLMNERGGIVEGLASNLFIVKKGTLFTPALSTGCVDGVMRRFIMEIAEKESMVVVEAENISEEFLLDADELFLSNAVQGIQWVMGYKGKRFLYSTSKSLSALLNKYINDL